MEENHPGKQERDIETMSENLEHIQSTQEDNVQLPETVRILGKVTRQNMTKAEWVPARRYSRREEDTCYSSGEREKIPTALTRNVNVHMRKCLKCFWWGWGGRKNKEK